jgi:hypothetical protein
MVAEWNDHQPVSFDGLRIYGAIPPPSIPLHGVVFFKSWDNSTFLNKYNYLDEGMRWIMQLASYSLSS